MCYNKQAVSINAIESNKKNVNAADMIGERRRLIRLNRRHDKLAIKEAIQYVTSHPSSEIHEMYVEDKFEYNDVRSQHMKYIFHMSNMQNKK